MWCGRRVQQLLICGVCEYQMICRIYVLPDYNAAVGKLNLAPHTRGKSKRVNLVVFDWPKSPQPELDVQPGYKSANNIAQQL